MRNLLKAVSLLGAISTVLIPQISLGQSNGSDSYTYEFKRHYKLVDHYYVNNYPELTGFGKQFQAIGKLARTDIETVSSGLEKIGAPSKTSEQLQLDLKINVIDDAGDGSNQKVLFKLNDKSAESSATVLYGNADPYKISGNLDTLTVAHDDQGLTDLLSARFPQMNTEDILSQITDWKTAEKDRFESTRPKGDSIQEAQRYVGLAFGTLFDSFKNRGKPAPQIISSDLNRRKSAYQCHTKDSKNRSQYMVCEAVVEESLVIQTNYDLFELELK